MTAAVGLTRGRGAARTALLTGATGRIGRGIALRLAQSKHRVVLVGRDAAALHALRSELPMVRSGAHGVVVVDLEDGRALHAAMRGAVSEYGRFGVFAHLACPPIVSERDGFDRDYASAMMAVNCYSFVEIGRALLADMMVSQSGVLAGFLSEAIRDPVVTQWSTYVSAKMALLGSMIGLAQVCRGTGVRCVGIVPGAVDFEDTPVPSGVPVSKQRRIGPSVLHDRVVECLVGENRLDNGEYRLISAVSDHVGVMTALPTVSQARVAEVSAGEGAGAQAATVAVVPDPAASYQTTAAGRTVADAFRRVFRLAPGADVAGRRMSDVPGWDSLGQLKLMMEVEQALGIRLSADAAGAVTSYRDLVEAVRAVLPDGRAART